MYILLKNINKLITNKQFIRFSIKSEEYRDTRRYNYLVKYLSFLNSFKMYYGFRYLRKTNLYNSLKIIVVLVEQLLCRYIILFFMYKR